MPYITKDDKSKFSMSLTHLYETMQNHGVTPGEMNYLFTELSKYYLMTKGTSYTHMNDVIGALEGCKLEFYRRVVSGYEDQKIEENGDVY